MREIIDDLHQDRKCHPEDSYSMQFTRFVGGKMIKSKRFDITVKTLKEIVGTNNMSWEIWEKDFSSGRYIQTDTTQTLDGFE